MAKGREVDYEIDKSVEVEVANCPDGHDCVNVQRNIIVEIDQKTRKASAVEYVGPGGKKVRIEDVVTETVADNPDKIRVRYAQEVSGITANSCMCCVLTPGGWYCIAWPCNQPCPW
jgi:hypothetical protein